MGLYKVKLDRSEGYVDLLEFELESIEISTLGKERISVESSSVERFVTSIVVLTRFEELAVEIVNVTVMLIFGNRSKALNSSTREN